MNYLASFFSHARAAQAAAGALALAATVRLDDFALEVDGPHGGTRWPARFMAHRDGRLLYTDGLGPGTLGFAGWMPYPRRHWPLALDKGLFKGFAATHGLATPAACRAPEHIGGPFVIKHVASSFGVGMRGPFTAFDAADPRQRLAEGEYYENFIVGLAAKAWCWGPACVALHLHRPSIVTGDGSKSVRDLVLALPTARPGDPDWDTIGCLARHAGLADGEAVVPAGRELLVEYRYGSRYEIAGYTNPNVLDARGHAGLAAQFRQAADVLAGAIDLDPADGASLFTLDAVVDADGTAWFLEMNCNPQVHPDCYRPMLAALRSPAATPVDALPA